MWEFITQNWWVLLFIAFMFYMHRSGAGCCGGGMTHGHNHSSKKELQDTSSEGGSCCGGGITHGHNHSSKKEPLDTNIGEASCCGGQKSK